MYPRIGSKTFKIKLNLKENTNTMKTFYADVEDSMRARWHLVGEQKCQFILRKMHYSRYFHESLAMATRWWSDGDAVATLVAKWWRPMANLWRSDERMWQRWHDLWCSDEATVDLTPRWADDVELFRTRTEDRRKENRLMRTQFIFLFNWNKSYV